MTVARPPVNPPAPARRRLSLRWLVSGASIAALLLAWYLATGPLELLSAVQLPSPADAWDALREIAGDGYADGTLLQHIAASTGLVLYGFAAAALTGVPLGILMGQSRLVEAYVNPVFQIVRPIAPIAWIPLTILWFGLGTSAKVFVIWLAAFAPTVINTHTGVRNIDSTLLQAARVNGAAGRLMLLDVIVPGALPAIFTGLRTSLQACWMVLVAAELVGSFVGLGHVLIIATRDLNSGMIVVAMAAVAVMGMLMSVLLAQVERKVMPWESLNPARRGGAREALLRRVAERWLMPALGIATLFGGWALLSGLGLVSPAFLPGPLTVLRSMAEHTREPYAGSVLQVHLLASLEKFLISFSIAVLLGVPLGLFMGRFKTLHWAVGPVFEAFRFIPPIAWVPFAIFWFGTGFLSPTLVIFAGAFAPCVLNAYRGARQIDRALIEAGQMLGAGRWTTLTEILLPASLAHIVAGIRVGAGFGWQSLIGAELIVGSTGLGYMIVQGGSNLEPAIVISGMITIGLIGAGIDFGMRALQRRVQRDWSR